MSGKGFSLRADLMILEYQESNPTEGVHHWDPRTKLVLLVTAIGLNVVVANLWLSTALFLVAIALIIRSRIPGRLFALFFLAPAWATLIVFLGFSVGFGTTPVAEIGPLTMYREGLAEGVSAAARVASEMSWMALVFLTTPFDDLLFSLRWFHVPKVLVDAIALAYRYAFMLFDEFHRMYSTARVKGGLATYHGKLKALSMVLAQVILRAYDRAGAIQQSMIARGAMSQTVRQHMETRREKEHSARQEVPRLKDVLKPDRFDEAQPVLSCRSVNYSYLSDDILQIDNLSLDVRKGEVVVLCGANGCGKSTLLKLLAGILLPGDGEIMIKGRILDRKNRNEAFHDVGLLFQDPDDQLFCTHVYDDIAYGPANMGCPKEEVDSLVQMAMSVTDVAHLADRPIHRLSYGEMKRIGLAGLIAMRPSLLLLDEPSAYLDPASENSFIGLVRRLNTEFGYTFIIVTHEMELAAQLATRVVLMHHGKIVADDNPQAVLTNKALLAQSRLVQPVAAQLFDKVGVGNLTDGRVPLTVEEARGVLQDWQTDRKE